MSNSINQLTEEQFDNMFTLMNNHLDTNASFNGEMFETYGDELDYVISMSKQNRVVTILERDGDEVDEGGYLVPMLYYASGMHLINRIGYLITKESIETESEFEVTIN